MSKELEEKDEVNNSEIESSEVKGKRYPTGKLAVLIGLIAAVTCLIPIISLIFAIIGIIMGNRAKKYNEDKTLGNLALVSSIFAIVINIIITITTGVAIYTYLNVLNGLNKNEIDMDSRVKIMDFFDRLDITLDKMNIF